MFVTGRNKAVIEDHFDNAYELEDTLRLSAARPRSSNRLLEGHPPGRRLLAFTRQQAPLGFGHAVWCAREFVGDEPFAVLLPDMVTMAGGAAKPQCLAQCVEAYEKHGGNIIAVEEVPPEETHQYGVVATGKDFGRDFEITGMVEKPPKGTAPSNLIISGRYILQPEIFGILEKVEKGAGGEIQLTDGMIALGEVAGFSWRAVRRADLRLRLEDRLPRRQSGLRAGAAGTSGRAAGRGEKIGVVKMGGSVHASLRPICREGRRVWRNRAWELVGVGMEE